MVPTLLQGEERANVAKQQEEEDRIDALVAAAVARRVGEVPAAAVAAAALQA